MQTLSQLRYFRPRLYLFQLRGEAEQRVFAPVCGGELGTDRQPVMPVKRHDAAIRRLYVAAEHERQPRHERAALPA